MVIVALIAILYWFFGTEVGCGIRATGANRNMSRAQGINTGRNTVIGLMISNGLVALAGGAARAVPGLVHHRHGRGAIVIGLGRRHHRRGGLQQVVQDFSLKLLACVIGSIIYYVVIQVVLRLGLDPNDLKLFTALIVAVFLAIPTGRASLSVRRTHARQAKEETNNA